MEKHLDGLKKSGRALGNNSLADRAKKEEIATVQKIYDTLTKENKDVRKAEWTGKEVSISLVALFPRQIRLPVEQSYDDKELLCSM